MQKVNRKFILVDIFYIVMAILPILAMIVLKVIFSPPTEGITVTGALIYFTIPMPIQDFPITEAQVNSVMVIISFIFICLYFTHGLKEKPELKRQHIAEKLVEMAENLVTDNMGEYFRSFSPFIGAVLVISAFSSLLSLFGLFPPTSDINVVAGWAILVFILITYYKMKCGFVNYAKGFLEPVAFLAPINVISELATPFAMAFRHYGNVLSGTVISVLLAAAFGGLSSLALSWAPEFIANIPIFRVGIPAVLSMYFDVFSGLLQAYIFAMLTMLNISTGFDLELFNERQAKKNLKKQGASPENQDKPQEESAPSDQGQVKADEQIKETN